MSKLKMVRLLTGELVYDCDVFEAPNSHMPSPTLTICITGNLCLNSIWSCKVQTGGNIFLSGTALCGIIASTGDISMQDCSKAGIIYTQGNVSLVDDAVAGDILAGGKVSLRDFTAVSLIRALDGVECLDSAIIGDNV